MNRLLNRPERDLNVSELKSISEVAKHLGLPRPTLSRIIKESKIKTTRNGNRKLVSVLDCQERVQILSANGKLRVKKVSMDTSMNASKQPNEWEKLYKEMKQERDEFKEKCNALEAENRELIGDIKLLEGSKSFKNWM